MNLNYKMYTLEFPVGVHLGKNALDDTDICVHADTLFSALCHEALKMECLEQLVQWTSENKLLFSDSFPYMDNQFYLPKPIVWMEHREDKGDSSLKKSYKKMQYIVSDFLEDYFGGTYPRDSMDLLEQLGSYSMKVSVSIRGQEEPLPYRVRYYVFADGAGLYLLVGYKSQEQLELFDMLMNALSYSGIGGKRSAGYGRFCCHQVDIPSHIGKWLSCEGQYQMLLSTALPEDSEMIQVLNNASYELIRRSGFIASETYAKQQMRKRDLYVFRAGSCFRRAFCGELRDVSDGGRHPVYRYAKGMFMGVNL